MKHIKIAITFAALLLFGGAATFAQQSDPAIEAALDAELAEMGLELVELSDEQIDAIVDSLIATFGADNVVAIVQVLVNRAPTAAFDARVRNTASARVPGAAIAIQIILPAQPVRIERVETLSGALSALTPPTVVLPPNIGLDTAQDAGSVMSPGDVDP